MDVSENSGRSSGPSRRTRLGTAYCDRRMDVKFPAIPAPAKRNRYISVSQKYASSSNAEGCQEFDSNDEDDSCDDHSDHEEGYEWNYEPRTRRKESQSAYTLEEDIYHALSQRRKARQRLRETPSPGPSRWGEAEFSEISNHNEQQGQSILGRTSVAGGALVAPMVAQTSTSRRYGHRLRRERFTERLTADEIQLKTKPKPTSEPLPQAELETVTASLKESMIKGQGGQDNQVEERVEKGKGRRQAASGAKTPVDELASLEKVVVDKEKNQGQASSSTKKIFKELARLKKVVAGK